MYYDHGKHDGRNLWYPWGMLVAEEVGPADNALEDQFESEDEEEEEDYTGEYNDDDDDDDGDDDIDDGDNVSDGSGDNNDGDVDGKNHECASHADNDLDPTGSKKYHAVVLDQIFKDIAADHRHRFTELKLFQASDK